MSELPHPPTEHLAKVIPIQQASERRRQEPESQELVLAEMFEHALAEWRHPSLPAHLVAKSIVEYKAGDPEEDMSEPLHEALTSLSTPDDLYDTLIDQHLAFQDMEIFLKETRTRSDQEGLADERRATLLLMELYAAAVVDKTGRLQPEEVTQVFRKLVRGIDHTSG